MRKKRKLFCEYGPIAYEISLRKECAKRNMKDIFEGSRFAKGKAKEDFKYIWKGETKILLRNLHGVDMELQKNKIKNLEIAGKKINNIIVRPDEIFSFWNTVGSATKKKGYLKGLVISNGEFKEGYGGGLCQLANLIHYLVLHTPLKVVELHHNTDALFPDSKRRVPFGTGTSIVYKNLDYRFKNTTDVPIQIKIWQDDKMLYGQIRADVELEKKYKLVEEDHHYSLENEEYYRNSKVYRVILDKKTNEKLNQELILDNHSKVMYDYDLIPKDEIR